MMEGHKKFTFDNVVRGILWAIVITGIVMLLNRLSAVLVPFFLAWLIFSVPSLWWDWCLRVSSC